MRSLAALLATVCAVALLAAGVALLPEPAGPDLARAAPPTAAEAAEHHPENE